MNYPWHWDHFWDKYPYTDFHELNLDWLIHQMKYWYKCIDYVQQAIATGSEDHNKYYESPHQSGDLVWWNDEFYRLTKDVAAGDDIDCNSLEHISVEDLLDEEEAARIAADNAERAARIAADNQLQKNIDAEASTRKSADDALNDRIDKEITDRTNADSTLQSQITSNDSDIANLQSCCSTVQSTLTDHETRITKNRTDIDNLDTAVSNNTTNITNNDNRITNLYNQINSGTSESGEKDTNTLTQLSYHRWESNTVVGSSTALTTLLNSVYTKIQQLVAAGTNAELIRLQIYGGYTGTNVYGLYATGFLNSISSGYEFTAVDDSVAQGNCGIYKFEVSPSGFRDTWLFDNSTGTWTYSRDTNLEEGFTWKAYLIYQTADYIDAT